MESGADPGFWSGGPSGVLTPGGSLSPILLKSLPENCMILKKFWGQRGGRTRRAPLVGIHIAKSRTALNPDSFISAPCSRIHKANPEQQWTQIRLFLLASNPLSATWKSSKRCRSTVISISLRGQWNSSVYWKIKSLRQRQFAWVSSARGLDHRLVNLHGW